jgi:hypothetical protein
LLLMSLIHSLSVSFNMCSVAPPYIN